MSFGRGPDGREVDGALRQFSSGITLSIGITEGADTVAATLNSTFNVSVAITEGADVVAATLTAAAIASAASNHPYQPILTVGRLNGR